MATIQRFEDIEAWRKARELTRQIYEISRDGTFSRDFGLRDQLRRASVSIMANIAEGFGRCGDREFQQFLFNAQGSAREVQAELYVALDVGFIDADRFDQLYRLCDDIAAMIAGLVRYLQQSDYRGSKYKRR